VEKEAFLNLDYYIFGDFEGILKEITRRHANMKNIFYKLITIFELFFFFLLI